MNVILFSMYNRQELTSFHKKTKKLHFSKHHALISYIEEIPESSIKLSSYKVHCTCILYTNYAQIKRFSSMHTLMTLNPNLNMKSYFQLTVNIRNSKTQSL